MAGKLEPTTQKFIDDLVDAGAPPIYTLDPKKARAVLSSAQAGFNGRPEAEITDTSFPVGPEGTVSVRIVRPKDASGPLPVAMHFHGGGWVVGDKDTHDRMTRELAVRAHIVIMFLNFTPAPEAHYPTQIEEAYAATKFVADHGTELNVDTNNLALIGDSAGGNIAIAVALMAKERGGPKINFQLLYYPITDATMDSASYTEFADGPWLTKKAMEWYWESYLPDMEKRSEITASPRLATIEQLRNLPDALIITAENDVLRDEGESFAQKLAQADVRVTSVRYNGTIHGFVLLNALADTPAARGAIAQGAAALKAALHKG